MDRMTDVVNTSRDDNIAAKHRFENFKMGKGLPASRPNSLSFKPSHHAHGRSHSRNISNSSASSLSAFPFVNSMGSSHVMNDMSNTTQAPTGPAPSNKRNSHHRRRSSVSTRHESAEMMGVAVTDLPASSTEDNVNFGDKDSIRRRALWALEGKGEVAFSKVEIPEPEDAESPLPEKSFDIPTKPSFPPSLGVSGNTFGGKRDSFKLLAPSISSKDQLHTLVEEEEEEEDCSKDGQTVVQELEVVEDEVHEPLTPDSMNMPSKPSTRPRPATLNLRPLSLTPDALTTTSYANLPTPTQTPSPRSGLKSLALVGSPTEAPGAELLCSPPMPARRPSLHLDFGSASPVPPEKPSRRSSISYKTSHNSSSFGAAGLPTPEMTPTSADRPRAEDEFFTHRPLSASEQHFLFKSHNALLGRITDLERALSRQSRNSRPMSVASDASSEPPSDEMLQLVSDLKAERDELKRDVEGWRTRVADLEGKVGVLGNRVENERREAWVARSQVGLLEVEKTGLERALLDKSAAFRESSEELESTRSRLQRADKEVAMLRVEAEAGRAAKEECAQVKAALEEARNKNLQLESALATSTSRSTFRASTGSEASSTDVDSLDFAFSKVSPLKAVHEEEEHAYDEDFSEEDDGLAGYEDEEDSDLSFRSPGNDSFGSDEEMSRSMRLAFTVPPLEASRANEPSPAVSPALATPAPFGHAVTGSLSKTWTFPRGLQQFDEASLSPSPSDDVDRFFGCLSDDDNAAALEYSAEDAKNPFSSGYKFGAGVCDDGEELPPFVVLPAPTDVDAIETFHSLDAVMEEEEEEEAEEESEPELDSLDADGSVDLFGSEVGGITFTFTPADESSDSPLQDSVSLPAQFAAPFFEDEEDNEDEEIAFTSLNGPITESPEPSPPRPVSSPSFIPRAIALRTYASTESLASSTPSRSSSSSPSSGTITPHTRRSSPRPSFIPQPVASPAKKVEAPQTPRVTFIRQPERKPINVNERVSVSARSPESPGSARMNASPSTPSDASFTSSPPAGRFSFQTFTNFIPRSWAAASPSSSPTSVMPSPPPPQPEKFIDREVQLSKLRRRLLSERHSRLGGCEGFGCVCKHCNGSVVQL